MGLWGIQASEFWGMHPQEWWYLYDARVGEPKVGPFTLSEYERYVAKLS